jgi:hypothetical protein
MNKCWEEEAQNLAGSGVSVSEATGWPLPKNHKQEKRANSRHPGYDSPPKKDKAIITYRKDGKKKATDEGPNGRTLPWLSIARPIGNQTNLRVETEYRAN